MQDNQRPISKHLLACQTRRLFWILWVQLTLQDQTAAAEHFCSRYVAWQTATKLARQLANRIAQPEHDRLAALVDLPARVVERVHRRVRENEKVGFRNEARQQVLKHSRKIMKVNQRVSQHQELRQRQLSFTEDAKTCNERFARITLAHHSRA